MESTFCFETYCKPNSGERFVASDNHMNIEHNTTHARVIEKYDERFRWSGNWTTIFQFLRFNENLMLFHTLEWSKCLISQASLVSIPNYLPSLRRDNNVITDFTGR